MARLQYLFWRSIVIFMHMLFFLNSLLKEFLYLDFALFRCFKLLFSPNVTLDEDKDLELQNRIRNLNWISTEHLNASV
jgi:hypothetical protein